MSGVVAGGVVILTAHDAAILYQAAGISDLRTRYRVGDSRIYKILNDISQAAFLHADPGNEPRQEAASEEPGMWTVQRIAKAARLAPRTVRLDIERGTLPAQRPGHAWVIDPNEAATYIAARRKS